MEHSKKRHLGIIRIMRCVLLVILLPLIAHAGPIYNISIDPTLYGNLKQTDVWKTGPSVCGPTAAVNSFIYLQNKYPNIYDSRLVPNQAEDKNKDGIVDIYDHMIAAALVLSQSNYMDPANGTSHEEFISGKKGYVDVEAKVPGQTNYAAQDPFKWSDPNTRPEYVENEVPQWDFLFKKLKIGADIELLIEWPIYPPEDKDNDGIEDMEGHWITLTSFHWEDVNSDGLVQRAEAATIDFIDPMTGLLKEIGFWHDTTGGKRLLFTDFAKDSRITVAVSESVPEPSTVLLTILGLSVLGLSQRKWRNLC
jgi:hypothetical protein